MDLKKIRQEALDWIDLIQDMYNCMAVLKTALDLRNFIKFRQCTRWFKYDRDKL
jgi:hypothetical protein